MQCPPGVASLGGGVDWGGDTGLNEGDRERKRGIARGPNVRGGLGPGAAHGVTAGAGVARPERWVRI